ncbi:MAG: hypothetical protein U0414_12865 [Polyangiaceae bacterium]
MRIEALKAAAWSACGIVEGVDDRPTSRQSGSFGIMTDICRLTIGELDGVLAMHPPEPDLAAVKALRAEAERLAKDVASWAHAEPSSDAKQRTMSATLDLRERVHKIHRRLGTK